MKPVRFFNRHTQEVETEAIYGEKFLRWAYGNPLGKAALHAFVKRPFFSHWYGRRMNQPRSSKLVKPFLETYEIDSSEFQEPPGGFQSFNEFFYRKLSPGSRPISGSPIVFPADGRHLGFQNAAEISSVFVKGQRFDLPQLLGSHDLAERYSEGALVLSRLCPVDYHRFHFAVEGVPEESKTLPGPLFSVSPLALRQNLSYLWQNKRTLTKINTKHFGQVLQLEIGATCVGSTIQTFTPHQTVAKGDEKGFFAFGGSSTILLFEPDRVRLAHDLLENTENGVELYAKMGSTLAHSHPS